MEVGSEGATSATGRIFRVYSSRRPSSANSSLEEGMAPDNFPDAFFPRLEAQTMENEKGFTSVIHRFLSLSLFLFLSLSHSLTHSLYG